MLLIFVLKIDNLFFRQFRGVLKVYCRIDYPLLDTCLRASILVGKTAQAAKFYFILTSTESIEQLAFDPYKNNFKLRHLGVYLKNILEKCLT